MSLLKKSDSISIIASNLSLLSLAGLLMISSNPVQAQTNQPTKSEPRLVFAHNHAYAPYGRTVEGYKQDMREAQKAGIDGFAINYGLWDGENGYYKRKVAMFFQAAKELNSGFKLFLSPDGLKSGNPTNSYPISPREVVEAMEMYGNHPNYWKYQGRPVLSAWHGAGQGTESLNAWKSILDPLRAKGMNVYFVPYFYVAAYAENPSNYDELKANYDGQINNARDNPPHKGWWSQVVDGMYSSATAGSPTYNPKGTSSVLAYGETLSRLMHENNKTFMASVSPYYWGQKQGTKENPNRRYFEFEGGKGLEAQWKSIIEKQKPEWVELFTWNDYTESTYFSPVQNLTLGEPSLNPEYSGPDFYHTHCGFLELNRYFQQWYKTGKKPAITEDKLFYFYRRQPKDTDAPDDQGGPVVDRHGDVQDALYITTMLTAPAELRVISGETKSSINVEKGMVHTRIPFQAGQQHFELWRGKKQLLQTTGSPIAATAPSYNFHVNSGFASSKARPDLIVTDLVAQSGKAGTYTLQAKVKNIGTAALPKGAVLNVQFVIEKGEASIALVAKPVKQALAVGETVTLETTPDAWQATAGDYRVWARVGTPKGVEEASDWNNTGTNGSSIKVTVAP